MNELVSIVVPIYNMGNSIEVCVKSLINQTYNNIEIILVDDGSTDNSYIRCKELMKLDKRIVVYHTENQGSGPARNYGIKKSNGKYIYFPDADDYLKSKAISKMVLALENGKYDVIVFGYSSLNKQGKEVFQKKYVEFTQTGIKIRDDYSDYMGSSSKYGIQGAPWNKIFNLEVIRNNNIQFPPLRRHQDEGFIARYMCYAKNVRFIEDILYIHYVNDLNNEWDKFPVNYIDVVIGLNDTRKETILTWNEKDEKTRELIQKEYICNVIKALEMSYSPKMKMNNALRKKWLKEAIAKAKLNKCFIPKSLGKYQKTILKYIKKNDYSIILMIMRIKIEVEKRGLLGKIRKK